MSELDIKDTRLIKIVEVLSSDRSIKAKADISDLYLLVDSLVECRESQNRILRSYETKVDYIEQKDARIKLHLAEFSEKTAKRLNEVNLSFASTNNSSLYSIYSDCQIVELICASPGSLGRFSICLTVLIFLYLVFLSQAFQN